MIPNRLTTANKAQLAELVAYNQFLADAGSSWTGVYAGSEANAIVYVSKLKKQTADSLYNFTVHGTPFDMAAGTSANDATTLYNGFKTALSAAGLVPILAS